MRNWRDLGQSIRAALADRSGQTIVLAALTLVPIIGFVGLGIDTAQLVMWKRQLRNAADVGASAGVAAKMSTSNFATLDVAPFVRKAVNYNLSGAITFKAIEKVPTTGPGLNDPNAVRVLLSATREMPFLSIFTKKPVELQAEATATSYSSTPFCMIALDTSQAGAFRVSGNGTLTMNCGVVANSNASGSIAAVGQYVDVPNLYTVGTVSTGSGLSSNVRISNRMVALPDPYASLPTPAPNCNGAPSVWTKVGVTQTISPGCYSSLRSSGTLRLSPGTYFINGGDLSVESSATVIGAGVTLIFLNTSNPAAPGKFTSVGSSTVQLSASTTGTYAGILMYQVRTAGYSNQTTFSISGTNSSFLQGAIYAKGSMVQFTGTSGMNTSCFQIAARYVAISGNATVSNQCPVDSGASAFNSKTIRLLG